MDRLCLAKYEKSANIFADPKKTNFPYNIYNGRPFRALTSKLKHFSEGQVWTFCSI